MKHLIGDKETPQEFHFLDALETVGRFILFIIFSNLLIQINFSFTYFGNS